MENLREVERQGAYRVGPNDTSQAEERNDLPRSVVTALIDVAEAGTLFRADRHDIQQCDPKRRNRRPCPTCDPFFAALDRLEGLISDEESSQAS